MKRLDTREIFIVGKSKGNREINKRLLTLGRVINALVDHSVHVLTGRKLTTLLRDSLGGKTKTCIMAIISPSIHCLEETLSTLDYAYCAKTIKNRPEVNQKVIKSELIKDLYTQIDRLKKELHATREKNGIYIPREYYMNEEAAKKKIECMEVDSGFKNKQLMELQELYINQQQLVEELSEKLEITQVSSMRLEEFVLYRVSGGREFSVEVDAPNLVTLKTWACVRMLRIHNPCRHLEVRLFDWSITRLEKSNVRTLLGQLAEIEVLAASEWIIEVVIVYM
ncbi:Kinesin-like protein KIN-5D [Camellia lanceoleosa]|uniref:Kinesin-like protein KIN-5D n=1 Tax=Camellia lanceoleosa TaxID=1840588 RepID=A0ACC0HP63_9ERIC|nr:Kinesin-like protein KIN-5D [Camellia lanceoleosa]